MSLLKWEGDYVKGRYISFVRTGNSDSGKTMIWEVRDEDQGRIGVVKWFASWRCYAFYPESNTVYETRCLYDLSDFCNNLTTEHKQRLTGGASEVKG